MLGSVWVNDVRLHARDSNDDGVPDNDNAGGPGVEDRLRVVGKVYNWNSTWSMLSRDHA